jgi:peptidoglycan hydrolase CwlO-like protein
MNTFLSILKKIPFWGWVAIAISILFLVNYASSRALNRSLFNMALDQLRKDQSQIVREKDEWIKTCEKQILDLRDDIEKVQKEKAIERARAAESAAEVVRLKGRINALQVQIDNIVVSHDPDAVLDSLRKQGIRSIKRRNTP